MHIIHTFGLSHQAEDKEIYNLATKKNCFVVTINYRHFRNILRPNYAGVITLPSGLSNTETDQRLYKFVSKSDPTKYIGKLAKL